MLVTETKESLRAMTLWSFVNASRRNLQSDQVTALHRQMQNNMFGEIWCRVTGYDRTIVSRTYSSIGLLTGVLLEGAQTLSKLKAKLSKRPFYGTLRAKFEYHNDIRFVVISCSAGVYLLMDNSAIDNKMPTVMKYSDGLQNFSEHDQSLLEFCLCHDIKI